MAYTHYDPGLPLGGAEQETSGDDDFSSTEQSSYLGGCVEDTFEDAIETAVADAVAEAVEEVVDAARNGKGRGKAVEVNDADAVRLVPSAVVQEAHPHSPLAARKLKRQTRTKWCFYL
jgi:hypothetical protein